MKSLRTTEIAGLLDRVDWNFHGATTAASSIHTLHWFPGNFIHQIPSYLIHLLSKEGDVVFDPFCGSGTTGVEAVLLGRRTIQSDINRASIQVASGKIAAILNPGIRENLLTISRSKLVWNRLLHSDHIGPNGEGSNSLLLEWFHEETLAQLRYLWKLIEEVEDVGSSAVLNLLFSDTLFACASPNSKKGPGRKFRKHHWGWIADNVRIRDKVPHDAIDLFRKRCDAAADILLALPVVHEENAICMREDARHLSLEGNSVDLIVTSPPYLGMIDYALANRLIYLWMGWPLIDDVKVEIGTRRKRNSLAALPEYYEDMNLVIGEFERVLKNGSFCAIVIGASRKFPNVSNQIIENFSKKLKVVWGPCKRIPSNRRISERGGTDISELICVFQKN